MLGEEEEENGEAVDLRHTVKNEEEGGRRGRSVLWTLMGKKIPRSELTYLCQMTLIYIVVITSLVNLTTGTTHTELFVSLLSSALGLALPSPHLHKK